MAVGVGVAATGGGFTDGDAAGLGFLGFVCDGTVFGAAFTGIAFITRGDSSGRIVSLITSADVF